MSKKTDTCIVLCVQGVGVGETTKVISATHTVWKFHGVFQKSAWSVREMSGSFISVAWWEPWPSTFEIILQLLHYINYLLTYLLT